MFDGLPILIGFLAIGILLAPVAFLIFVIASYFSKSLRAWIEGHAMLYKVWKIFSGGSVAIIGLAAWALLPSLASDDAARENITQKELGTIYFSLLLEEQRNGPLSPSIDTKSLTNLLPKYPMFSVNWAHQITDQWGTPIQIDLSDPMHPVIRSAGRDRMWNTSDDLLFDKASAAKLTSRQNSAR